MCVTSKQNTQKDRKEVYTILQDPIYQSSIGCLCHLGDYLPREAMQTQEIIQEKCDVKFKCIRDYF